MAKGMAAARQVLPWSLGRKKHGGREPLAASILVSQACLVRRAKLIACHGSFNASQRSGWACLEFGNVEEELTEINQVDVAGLSLKYPLLGEDLGRIWKSPYD